MPRESKANKQKRAVEVCSRLTAKYPEADCALNYTDPFTLTIAVLLSAQTTDAQVNKVTPNLFEKWPTCYDLAQADLQEVQETIHSLGFYKNKAKHCIGCAQMVVSDFSGQVPKTMPELIRLPGVGRKTANIVLNIGYGIVEGIAVDTHVFRIASRLKLTSAKTPAKAEDDLLNIIPKELWGPVNHTWILFGREICDAKSPRCDICPLQDICPSAFKPPLTKKQYYKKMSSKSKKK